MRARLWVGVIAILLGAPWAAGSIIVLGASKDTTLFEDAAGGIAGGHSTTFFVGRLGSNGNGLLRRGALAFDLSSIPNTATITSVSLTLTELKGNGGPQGTIPAPNDATWKFNFFNTSTWTNLGGDFDNTLSATRSADFSGQITWPSTPKLISDVQGWLTNPSTNFGWLLTGNETTLQTAKEFATRENLAGQPALSVTFTVPEPASAATLAIAAAMLLLRRHRLTVLPSRHVL